MAAFATRTYTRVAGTSNDLSSSKQEATAKFVIGPTTERSFWENEKRELDIDRDPCRCIL